MNWRSDNDLKGNKGRKIALDLFDTFIAYECDGCIKQEILLLLSELIIDNFEESEW